MNKPKMLYASPFPPKRSGISEYSSVLVGLLARDFDITLYADDYELTDSTLQAYPVLRHGRDEIRPEQYDVAVYNIGNSEFHDYIYDAALAHPGVVILHEVVLYHFILTHYGTKGRVPYEEVYRRFGPEIFFSVKEAVKCGDLLSPERVTSLPMYEELLRSGNRIIVHSAFSREKILQSGLIPPEKVAQINMPLQTVPGGKRLSREALCAKYGIPEGKRLICSFGMIQNAKKNLETCRAVKALAAEGMTDLYYLMVGSGDYADGELCEGIVGKTGYTELDDFNSLIAAADIIVNLRYPSLGETSAALLRILQERKACITNDGGWFSEIPDSCVRKIPTEGSWEEHIAQAIRELLETPGEIGRLEREAGRYIETEYDNDRIEARFREELMIGVNKWTT